MFLGLMTKRFVELIKYFLSIDADVKHLWEWELLAGAVSS